MKPNKVKFALGWHDENQVLQVHPDPSYPDKWKEFSEFFLAIGEQLAIAVFTQEGVLAIGNTAKKRWQKDLTN